MGKQWYVAILVFCLHPRSMQLTRSVLDAFSDVSN